MHEANNCVTSFSKVENWRKSIQTHSVQHVGIFHCRFGQALEAFCFWKFHTFSIERRTFRCWKLFLERPRLSPLFVHLQFGSSIGSWSTFPWWFAFPKSTKLFLHWTWQQEPSVEVRATDWLVRSAQLRNPNRYHSRHGTIERDLR